MIRTRSIAIIVAAAAVGFGIYTQLQEAPPPAARQVEGLCVPASQSGAVPDTAAQWAKGAQLFEGLSDFHRKATTSSDEAQKYFDQGMRYLWAFNHDESTRSFAQAAQLDPHCAICWW